MSAQAAQGLADTALTRALGMRYPVVQTAMGWVADPGLVAATTNAGGFGFLAAAVMSAEEIGPALEAVRAKTDGPFGVNFHMFQPSRDAVIAAILDHKDRVRAVSYGRGPDAATIARFKAAGILCMPTVGALKHAVKAVDLGADIITVQGGEGGGHTGAVPTSLLLPQVLDAVDVPVVAAGGFHDGRGLAAALAWGAAGIAMGTRFLMTTDSPVNRQTLAHYERVKDTGDVRITHAVDGLSQRFVYNDEIKRLESMGKLQRLGEALRHARRWGREAGLSYPQMAKLAWTSLTAEDGSFAATVQAPNLPRLVQLGLLQGDTKGGLLPAGQVAVLIDEIESCDTLITRIMQEAEGRIAALCGAKEP